MSRAFNSLRFLTVFIIVLFGFLSAAGSWLSAQQKGLLISAIDDRARHDLDSIADLALEALVKSDYMTVRAFVERWGEEHQEYQSIRFVSANGFVIAEHTHPTSGAKQRFTLAKDILIGHTKVASATLAGDYREAESLYAHLRDRLILGAGLIAITLGAVLWFVMHNMALAPLEAMVKERTQDLSEANATLTREIADRKSLQQELEQREEWISLLLDSVAEGIYGIGLDGNCTFCNPAALKLFGYERQEELIGRHIHSIIHHSFPNGDPYPVGECKIYRCLADTAECGYHVEDDVFWRADGTHFPVEYWAQPIIRNGERVGVVVAFTDISHHKKAAEDLRKAAQEWQETFDAANEAIWILDQDQRIIRSNAAAARLFQVSPEEIIAKQCWQIVHHTDEPVPDCPTLRVRHSHHRETMELQAGERWLEVTVDPIMDEHGQCQRYVHTVSDITQRRKLEEQIRQGQKMEALGTLAGGIAHDFNNILNVIIGYTELAKLDYADPEKVRQDLDEIGQGTERARQLVKQILSFSRKKTSQERHPLQVALIVKEVLKMMRASLPSTIEIRQQIQSEGLVEADPTQIHQVIMNLCTNAFHAMKETGGTLSVTLDEIGPGTEGGDIAAPDEGRYIRLSIADTGAGIPPDLIGKIFEPYFTTKGISEGTGLGLAVVHGIVDAYHGRVTVTSRPGEGTTFQVLLPLLEAHSDASRSEASNGPAASGHGERILFVDDEAQLCEVAGAFFAAAGYSMESFADPLLAWQAFEKDPHRFDLVITDMTMPHITGAELSRRVLAVRNDIPIMICTGYSAQIDKEKAALAGITAYLTKPVSPQGLLDAAQKILGARQSPG